ncbi:hypothetical protein BDY17DRAFT_346752 [Neohortaea acidophila]|uniref:ZZ-type domain-containing protein n=1 Tax=Neohortaea acidophila TaxID=245834 RepID=A0A6A6PRJ7_9PEZI|nr:uncharacterized protein BDY17DRAFT_346752 [Neohortaea acidophila]KAF2482709.1 hypothetical protein BDY17DRAFT_346752 [Neohortaea acidophila]
MATTAQNTNVVSPDTLITIKVSLNDSLKKLKLPLRDLGANVLIDKLRHTLGIKPEHLVVFERFSDSAGGYIILDPENPQVFKTLIRAAKAKLKLRLKATVVEGSTTAKKEVKETTAEPLIVHTPAAMATPRDSTAIDGRSVGTGIFEFREARGTQQTPVDTSDAPTPRPFVADFKDQKVAHGGLAFRTREPAVIAPVGHPWSVYCNECDAAMADAHYHCSICDGGDYDLCERCVSLGKLCPGDGHWLIKRFIKDGKVINSTTERISPRKLTTTPAEPEAPKAIPGAFTDETKTLSGETIAPTRTCNNCVIVHEEHQFVTCTSCDDFDLCIKCHGENKHGHHPAHGFKPATAETILTANAAALLAPGRNVWHSAICDGCEKSIFGVRHKCLNCPDWDYCNECVKNARATHPRHRFAAIYTPIANVQTPYIRHFGIYCDGPLCSGKDASYISGVRYKCAVCHDTDFCAACEALPSNTHNRTHPLIKFKTPVRNVSITTENEDLRGNTRVMGDRRSSAQTATRSASTETTPVQQTHAATQVQTMAEIMPTVKKEVATPTSAEVALTRLLPAPGPVVHAHFVEDSIKDGTVVEPGARFTQVWTMRNPGPQAWPAGCSVRFVGGDNMLDVDNTRPSAVSDIANASESNVIGREVGVGESVAFKITLKAPMREGKNISYWRMKLADGTPFGHRLWCDVDVKASKNEETPAPQLYSPLAAFNAPFNAHQQAQLSRMHAIRQQQMHLARHHQMLAQQQQQQPMANPSSLPPAYDASHRQNVLAQMAAHREQQAAQIEKMAAARGREEEHGNEEEAKARREAAKIRCEQIKARFQRIREEKRAREATLKNLKKESAEVDDRLNILAQQAKAAEAEKPATAPVEKVEEKKAEQEEDLSGSQMVFPKLEKESPASSIHQSSASSAKAAYVENEAGEVERSATGSPTPTAVQDLASPSIEENSEDLGDDIGVLSAHDEESEDADDGFLTDEEGWDVLDASDAETNHS